jgi:signal transduction histidine kinase/ActR/RegA family two-component response regulator
MPTGRDGLLVCDMLRGLGIDACACAALEEFKLELQRGVGAVLIAEEALANGAREYIAEMSRDEPVWSDIPIVLFAGSGKSAEHLLATIGSRFNATIVERPIRITMLVSAVRGALRARQRQYETRDLLTQLEQTDKQKDLFLATLSHELRTPLNSILGWVQMMRGNSGESVDMERALEVIERNAKTQSELISDILFISRVITGKLELNTRPISITDVVRSALDVVRPAAQEKDIKLSFAFETMALDINGDFDRLQQVFWNLLSNAVKFTPEHGKVEVGIGISEKNVIIEIRDSGRGIDPEFLPYVFERFRQADNTYSRNVGGLGLGLAIVKHLVELHGGNVSAKSEGIDRGAVFTVALPALTQKTDTAEQAINTNAAAAPETDMKSLDGVRILLVEDDADSREMLAASFSLYGFKTITAGSAAEALEVFRSFQPDLMVSDVGLPGEDGYSLMRKIRALPRQRDVIMPAIALTGYVSIQDQITAREAGYQEHLAKPVDIDELADLIFKLLKS